ncbi:tail fiber assembly protein [Escherichia coli]|nr:tail fiber assembly protein [Escherichia coli]EIQ4654019.1 tail fiber assembly protein [Escherichia coli]ELC3907042.1 tail fiber assembly protein [Escherichia coli]ELE5766619.1 tail fiber assembly protein [Escherichia coli]HAZ3594137.1 tail fiber assembly protein [Escherichia coli]
MDNAVLNSELIATKAGNITVYNYDGETREYISTSNEYLAIGVGIPAYSCLDAPGTHKAGYAICRSMDLNSWEYVSDHRGEMVYSTETGDAKEIIAPGDYPENTTTIAPLTPYDKWDGDKWVTDINAQHVAEVEAAEQQKSVRLLFAKEKIILWQTELQLGIISDEDKEKLMSWVNYIKAVQAVDTQKAHNIIWPEKPFI